jgi:hypothetical protein
LPFCITIGLAGPVVSASHLRASAFAPDPAIAALTASVSVKVLPATLSYGDLPA